MVSLHSIIALVCEWNPCCLQNKLWFSYTSNFIAADSNPWTIEIGNSGNQNSLAGVSVDAAQIPCSGHSLPT